MNKGQDRKTKHYGDTITINNEVLRINSGIDKGIYIEIIERMVSQLDIALAIHKRLLVCRIDLHTTYFSKDNKIISKYLNRAKQWIRRNYNIKNIGHIWVREQQRSKKQHYHLALFIDGDKIRYPAKLLRQLKEMWLPLGYMPTVKNPYYFIDKHNKEEMRGEVIYRVSYLAKTRTKRYRDSQVKDYQTSRLVY